MSLEEIWRQKNDEEIIAAFKQLVEYNSEAKQVIRAEFFRRNISDTSLNELAHQEKELSQGRKWKVAGLFTFLLMGLGQVYNGQWKKGAFFFVLLIILIPFLFMTMLYLPFATFNIIVPLLILIAVCVYVFMDAITNAKRLKVGYRLKPYNKWYLYLLAVVVCGYVLIPVYISAIRTYLTQAYRIPSGAMEPTLMVGDNFLADKIIYRFQDVKSGDIIIFRFPRDERRTFIKRVVGLPNEDVMIRGKRVYVNCKTPEQPELCKPLDETYAVFKPDGKTYGLPFQKRTFRVPPRHYFVLGDNRDNSQDSRYWGFLNSTKIIGKASVIYLSWNPLAKEVRWGRIGQIIQ